MREPGTVARWRALGFDGALVGEALVRAGDPTAAARAFVAAGVAPDDPANVARRPLVKICGVTDEAGVLAAVAAGADAIGLNVVPGTPRALELAEAATARPAAPGRAGGGRRPLVVAITADADCGPDGRDRRRLRPGRRPAQRRRARSVPRPVARRTLEGRCTCRRRAGDLAAPTATSSSRARGYLAGGADRILLDTAGGRTRAAPGTRASERLAAAVAREVPVVLAGGLDPANVAGALRDDPGRRRRRRLGRRAAARRRASVRPRTRSASPCSSSAPAPPATIARTSRSARRRSTPACSTPTAPVGGGWSATSADGTSPRR